MTTTLASPALAPAAPAGPRAYLAELQRWLARCTAQFRTARIYAAASHFEVGEQILADELEARACEAALAHRAEVHDLEARRYLAAVLADGAVTPAELPALRRTLSLVERSAAADHDLAESLTVRAA